MNKCNPKELIKAVPDIQTVVLPKGWFENLDVDISVFNSFYDWMLSQNRVPTEDEESLHNRTYVGEKIFKKLLSSEKKRIKKKLNLKGEKLNEAVSWSDINSGPKTEIGGLPISGDGIFVIPEKGRDALNKLSIKIYQKVQNAAISKSKSTAAGATFYQWLLSQIECPDNVGDLARDAAGDTNFPQKSNSYEEIKNYLHEIGACNAAIESFNEGWLEYINQYPERIKPYAVCCECQSVLNIDKALLAYNDDSLELYILDDKCLKKYTELEKLHSYPLHSVSGNMLEKLQTDKGISKYIIDDLKEQLALWNITILEEKQKEDEGYVYFIMSDKTQAIKIGFTGGNVKNRLSALQTAHPYKLKVLATLNGNRSYEKELHQRFAQFRLEGEWFEPHPDLLAFISVIQTN